MMEIPIQVAVRIYPCLQPAATIPIEAPPPSAGNVVHTKSNTGSDEHLQLATQKDDNGNFNSNTVGEKTDTLAQDESSATENIFCVQAIPMAAPGFLNTAPTALPGQLDNGIAAGLMQVGPHSFPVTHALPMDCTQSQIYHQTVFPLISLFMEGFDASVVTYGQRGTGKTYTLYGPNLDCVYSDSGQGVVQRCVREIFAHMENHPERTYAVNIGWVEIIDDVIHDLLGVGNIHCDSITDVFHWLQLGLTAKQRPTNQSDDAPITHTLFTLTLEQQWVSKEGLIQHRLSTASFSDLCGTDRVFMLNALDQPTSLPKDAGLQTLEQVVNTLTDPALMYGANGNIPYNQTTLTTLLKDSFGGRAQTLLILCVSPLERDCNETICNLQFAFKVQCVRNYVIMNTFSDDNTPISPETVMPELPGASVRGVPVGADTFGLQFAASQWYKLVSNAEGLFSKLATSNAVTELDKEQIEEWLFLKQECEECLSSAEAIRSQKQLVPIQEADEPEEAMSEPETSLQQNSDNESDCESQRPDLMEKLEVLMEELRLKTDTLIEDKYKEFIQNQPKAVMESQESARHKESANSMELVLSEQRAPNEKLDERKASIGGRRRSIQPGASLSSAEIAMLNRVASREQAVPKVADDFLEGSGDLQNASQLRAAINSPLENIQKKLRKLDTDIEARQNQIQEVEQTMQLKQNIITELVKNSDTRSTAKQRFHKKKSKLESEYEKTKKQLAKAIVQGKDKSEVERLRSLIAHIEHRLQDLASMKHIAGESGQKVKKLQQSIHESKKLIDDLQKKLKKDRKQREQLEHELKALKEKENNGNGNSKALVKLDSHAPHGGSNSVEDVERGKNLKEVQARISHLDHVLREKSENLEQYGDNAEGAGEKEGLRHEIRNLRRTRDHLLEQRCTLDRKLKRDKMLSHREERKLLECDEAIEAIDAAIEFKNELICGHKSIDTSERLQREKGEQMLMARLNKLSPEEMRTLLYKYFTKVIDLRDSSRKLEVQLMQLERERDAWEWKERVLSNAVRQARLEGERNAVLLQRQHEMKLTLMLRHLAEETSASASSTSFNEAQHHQQQQQHQRYLRPTNLALTHQQQQLHAAGGAINTSSQYSDTDLDLDFYKNTTIPVSGKILKPPKHGEMEICPLPDALAKYKPLDKFKEKERESKNKLFAKFQVLTRYAGQSVTAAASNCAAAEQAGGSGRKKDKEQLAAAIPQENLKRLISTPPATKVTRQKNKIIIQDATRKN
ncbi:kinesin-like protein costa [Anastrepha ludens]|uniref:kinesin-like protein costa n=1 Tax=Anastrepha ludens TaxID=28586 RepID=UPI0023AFD4BC|nr:kinesin-like protein costa [Anastrepha ludens]XP_053965255.1 kinesin-like protein costa [Anastrepha ludens]